MDPHPIDPVIPTAAAIFFALYAIMILVVVIIAVAYYVVMSLALMRFFAKVGVEPWIAWVPFCSTGKWLEVGGFVTSVFLYIGMYRTGLAFRKSGEYVVLGIFLLARPEETYEPERIAAAGFPPPLAGFGSAPAA